MRSTSLWRVTAVLLCIAHASFAVTPLASPSLVLAGATPESVIERFERTAPKSAEDYFTLSLAHFGRLSIMEALEAANRALPLFAEPQKRALCYQVIAQCYGALGNYQLAAKAATDGQHLQPESRELAALRVVYYNELGDKLNFAVAEDHLKRLDPVYQKDPKLEPLTCYVVITGVVCVTAIVVKMLDSIDKCDDPEIRERITTMLEAILRSAEKMAMVAVLAGFDSKASTGVGA